MASSITTRNVALITGITGQVFFYVLVSNKIMVVTTIVTMVTGAQSFAKCLQLLQLEALLWQLW